MRVPMGDRLKHLARRGATLSWVALVEWLLLALLAVQVARLIWAVATPVGPMGGWQGRVADIPAPAARQALFASFDPFFRQGAQQNGGAVVTSLALTVHGIRLNEASGLGSAIIATPDGVQNSYAVGEEIMPGVVLKAVAFDHISIDRGGAEEQVFIDQSAPAPEANGDDRRPGAAAAPAPAASGAMPVTPSADILKRDIGFAPRMEDGRVTGLVLSAKGPGFAKAGFQPGDIVRQVNGRPIGAAADLATLQNQIAPGARLSLAVERGAVVVPIALTP